MEISAIVPVLDEEARLPDLIRSLRLQEGVSEILVVDGGSRDGSVRAAHEAGADGVLRTAPGRGLQLEAGAGAARGGILWFLHADTVLPPEAGRAILETLGSGPWVGGAFRVRHRLEGCGPVARRLLRVADLRSRVRRRPYGDQAVFALRKAHEACGGFPPWPLMEDLEYARRLRCVGPLRLLPLEVGASGRRFGARPWRTFLAWNTFPALLRLGVPPQSLARLYGRVPDPPRPGRAYAGPHGESAGDPAECGGGGPTARDRPGDGPALGASGPPGDAAARDR